MTLFSDSHEAFRSRIRQYVEAQLLPHADEWERKAEFPSGLMRELGRQGFFGLTHARQYGGQELDFGYNVVLAEELPRCKMLGLAISILAQNNIFPPLLATLGTEEQKQEFLAPAIRGEKIGAVASSEPTGGSDIVRSIQCAATDTGDDWIISGEKKFITNGPIADFVIVLARTKPEYTINSLTLIIVPTNTPGFRVKDNLRKLGTWTSPTGWLQFSDCRVSKRLTLGKPHLGYHYVARNILEERLLGGATAVALGNLVLQETIRYLQGRRAFNQRLSELQALRHRIAELAADIEVSKRFVYSLCEEYRDGKVEAREICMLKFHAAEMIQRVVERCLQFHGGSGFLEENWIARVYRDVRFLSVAGGPSELMKDLVAAYMRL